MIVAGIGCRPGMGGEAAAALVRRAEALTGRRAERLAAPYFRSGEAGLHAAAALLGLPLVLLSHAALASVQARCPSRSARARDAVGLASVAEAAALAAAGAGGRLILPRIAGASVTCALAAA